MAMNKKEQAHLEHLEALLALRPTPAVPLDLIASQGDGEPLKGYVAGHVSLDWRTPNACTSTTNSHTVSHDNLHRPPRSQGHRDMYSTRLAALRATRHALELKAARALREIDLLIEEELDKCAK